MCAKACWHLVKQLARIRRSMAKLPLATIREVLNIVDSGGNVPEAMRRTQESLVGEIADQQDEPKGWDAAQELLDAEIAKRGWRIHKESGAYRMALRALAEIAQENLSPPSNHLAGYMDAADKVGMTDTSKLQMATSGSDVVRRMALRTTLRGPLLDRKSVV